MLYQRDCIRFLDYVTKKLEYDDKCKNRTKCSSIISSYIYNVHFVHVCSYESNKNINVFGVRLRKIMTYNHRIIYI